MNKKLFLSLVLAGTALSGQADEARLLRFPSTNGQEVVFTYGGDLYKASINGGQATRLTSHVGYEMLARFSPDGRNIAFTGEYDGNREVYLIPAEGGEPRRLTYTATNPRDDVGDRMGPNNMVMTWTPDSRSIVYRNRISDSFDGKLWTVSVDGGMPEQIPLPEGGFCSYSPDGKRLAYNRVMREFRTWKYYRGGMADDIWIYDPQKKSVENITNNDAQDIIPMWIGNEIFFISDRDMTMNIFVYNTETHQTEKVTNYTDFDVKFPSTNGQIIVYENGGYLYKLDPRTRQSTKISISLESDNIYARAELRKVEGDVTAVSMSSDGHRLAVTARGEVFDVPNGNGVTKNLTRTPGANDRNADYSPDGTSIAYISDVTGETEVWMQPTGGGEPVQLTRDNDTYIRQLAWTPDSKKIVYTDRKNRIVLVDVAARSKRTLLTCPESEIRSVDISPDSQWLTYTKPEKNQMDVVYVYNLTTGKEYPVTEKWYNSGSPTFSTDGRYLIFTSDRDLNPIYSRVEWNYAYGSMSGVYMALLTTDTPSPLLPSDELTGTATDDSKAKDSKTADAKSKDAAQQAISVRIDTDDIWQRIIKLPLPTGNYRSFYSDGQKVYYTSGASTKTFDLKTQKEDTFADARLTTVPYGSKKALMMKGDKVYVVDLGGKAQLDKNVNLSDMTATVDYSQEWPQIFDEVWRAFRDGFYLENMHGVDWKAMKEKYSALLPYVKTRLDLNYVIGGMIAEMACGHAYVSPGEMPTAERIDMGLLGAELQRESNGYYRITKILEGAPYRDELRSPLTEPGMDIKVGDYITAIDGVSVKTTDNIYSLLVGKAGVLTELSVNSSASDNGARRVVVKPISNEYPLYHYEWVQNNIKTVEKLSGGRVGYIYIPDMGAEGLNEFVRYYYPQLDKEALIIDDRANGGGNVSPMIIERLLREPYRMTMYRTSSTTGTIPEGSHHGPKVLLINKYSASDGDLFPWSFKANNLGKIVGTRTWGGIIGISGSLPYMDGTDVRVPFFTNYDAKTGQWIVENHGVDPDIYVDNDPIREQAGEDQQLQRAVEEALKDLQNYKPLPGVPAPRTYKDLGLDEKK